MKLRLLQKSDEDSPSPIVVPLAPRTGEGFGVRASEAETAGPSPRRSGSDRPVRKGFGHAGGVSAVLKFLQLMA